MVRTTARRAHIIQEERSSTDRASRDASGLVPNTVDVDNRALDLVAALLSGGIASTIASFSTSFLRTHPCANAASTA